MPCVFLASSCVLPLKFEHCGMIHNGKKRKKKEKWTAEIYSQSSVTNISRLLPFPIRGVLFSPVVKKLVLFMFLVKLGRLWQVKVALEQYVFPSYIPRWRGVFLVSSGHYPTCCPSKYFGQHFWTVPDLEREKGERKWDDSGTSKILLDSRTCVHKHHVVPTWHTKIFPRWNIQVNQF